MSERAFSKAVSRSVAELNPGMFAAPPIPLAEQKPGKAEVKAERALQDEFENWLRQHGYVYRREPMHRATFAPSGHPDFTVNLPGGTTAYFEYKTATGKLSTDQIAWHKRAVENRTPVFVVRTLAFAIDCLRQVERGGKAR